MKRLLIFILLSALIGSCDYREREEALRKREAVLDQREQTILVRERSIALREEAIAKQQRLIDSTTHSDTTHQVSQALVGNWNVKMMCTETSCAGSAVGDTRTEKWQMQYEGTSLIARAMANDQLLRVYTGFFTGNTVELVEDPTNATAPRAAKMVVRLRLVDSSRLEGEREIVRDNNCKIVYATHMEKMMQ